MIPLIFWHSWAGTVGTRHSSERHGGSRSASMYLQLRFYIIAAASYCSQGIRRRNIRHYAVLVYRYHGKGSPSRTPLQDWRRPGYACMSTKHGLLMYDHFANVHLRNGVCWSLNEKCGFFSINCARVFVVLQNHLSMRFGLWSRHSGLSFILEQ